MKGSRKGWGTRVDDLSRVFRNTQRLVEEAINNHWLSCKSGTLGMMGQ